jgi:ribosomal protein S18 acetylase RimI-like enzyme
MQPQRARDFERSAGRLGERRDAGARKRDSVSAQNRPAIFENPRRTRRARTGRPLMRIEAKHDLAADDAFAIEERLYDHNRHAIGAHDGEGLGFVIRDEAGQVIGAALGYSWAGISELRQMWVDEHHRGKGFGRALLDAFVTEAQRRGVKRIWLSSYDFQAPAMYEKAGFVRMAELKDFPIGHTNTIFCKVLS